MTCRKSAAALIVVSVLILGRATVSSAQLKGHYIPGFAGLESGTQAPPSITLFAPFYDYNTSDLRNDDGDTVAEPDINVFFMAAGASWVTNYKILGGNLGGSIVPAAWIKSRIEGPFTDVPGSLDFTDIEIMPVQLGWHTARADFVTTYGLFMPTGKWHLGADDNAGLGMWSNLFQAGSTLRLDTRHAWSISALGSYEIHSDKENTDIQVGDIVTVEGGLGKSFYKMKMVGETPVPARITNIGLVYYGQFKVTEDTGGPLTPLFEAKKDHVYAAGVEGNIILPEDKLVLGLRIEPEFGARNRTQGWTFLLSAAYLFESLATE